jgi:hypothetical protein
MLLCNRRAPIDTNVSSAMDFESDLCGKPALYKDGGPNKTEFYYCEAHRNALVNGENWDRMIGKNLVPIDGTEPD